jgi:hypothetical protein
MTALLRMIWRGDAVGEESTALLQDVLLRVGLGRLASRGYSLQARRSLTRPGPSAPPPTTSE